MKITKMRKTPSNTRELQRIEYYVGERVSIACHAAMHKNLRIIKA